MPPKNIFEQWFFNSYGKSEGFDSFSFIQKTPSKKGAKIL